MPAAGSMDQRWQDLNSLLNSSSDPLLQHPHPSIQPHHLGSPHPGSYPGVPSYPTDGRGGILHPNPTFPHIPPHDPNYPQTTLGKSDIYNTHILQSNHII